jgi:zinc-binding in reverse transcriptase
MSPFWKEVFKELSIYNISINKTLANGNKAIFWEDRWISECTLSSQYPMLYELTSNKTATAAQIIRYNRYYLIFTRPLNDILHEQLIKLHSSLSEITLNTSDDLILWRWSSNFLFSTNSCYNWLNYEGMVNQQFQSFWIIHIPLKIKIFLWLAKQNKVLTRDNLIKRGW